MNNHVSNVRRTETLATFQRAAAEILNEIEGYNKDLLPDERHAYLPVEVVSYCAVLATIGPPLTEHETTSLDRPESDDPDDVADRTRRLPMTLLVGEILAEAAAAFERTGGAMVEFGDKDHTENREAHACQVAMLGLGEALEKGEAGNHAQECWYLVSNWLLNHDDAHWLLIDEDDEEDGG